MKMAIHHQVCSLCHAGGAALDFSVMILFFLSLFISKIKFSLLECYCSIPVDTSPFTHAHRTRLGNVG